MLFVVFAHQLVAVIMFVVVLVTLLKSLIEKRSSAARGIAICAVPALLLFLIIVYVNYVASPSFSILSALPSQDVMSAEPFIFPSYSNVLINTLGFLVFCYLPLAPIIVFTARHFRQYFQMWAWLSWVVLIILLTVISPVGFIGAFHYRWILLLSFPLALFTVDAFTRIKFRTYKIGAVLLILFLSLSFMFLPSNSPSPYFTLFNSYFPSSMIQNSVSFTDCQDTINALEWINTSMTDNSLLLTHEVFYGWAALTLDRNQFVSYGLAILQNMLYI